MRNRPLRTASIALLSLASLAVAQTAPADATFPVSITVDAGAPIGRWKPVQRFFGCDEPNYAYLPAGRRLLRELGRLGGGSPVYFRAHNMLTTGDGTPDFKWGSTNVYTEKPDGTPIYDFSIVDRIFDTYLAAGVKPYAQLGFMPEALSTHPTPYQHHFDPDAKNNDLFLGWTYPPKDYDKWGELCFRFVQHCVDRYGRAEVESWYWEVWNEANIGYWHGTPEEFLKLHDYAIAGVRRALPNARVGGPDSAGPGGAFMKTFVDHCLTGTNFATKQTGTPLDFVSFHAKGAPTIVDGHVRMNLGRQLQDLDNGFKQFVANPQTKDLPIIVGECDPEGCAACHGPQNAYRNGTMYSTYTVATFARALELADRSGANLEGLLTWAFEFENQPPFAGFRVLASGPIDHPVMNSFRLFAELKGDRLKTTSDSSQPVDVLLKSSVRDKPDVGAIAVRDGSTVRVLAWHYHDDDVAGPDASIELVVNGISSNVSATELRVDPTHANSFAAWKAMGSPEKPTPDQWSELDAASKMKPVALGVSSDKNPHVTIRLPRQGVALITLEPSAR